MIDFVFILLFGAAIVFILSASKPSSTSTVAYDGKEIRCKQLKSPTFYGTNMFKCDGTVITFENNFTIKRVKNESN